MQKILSEMWKGLGEEEVARYAKVCRSLGVCVYVTDVIGGGGGGVCVAVVVVVLVVVLVVVDSPVDSAVVVVVLVVVVIVLVIVDSPVDSAVVVVVLVVVDGVVVVVVFLALQGTSSFLIQPKTSVGGRRTSQRSNKVRCAQEGVALLGRPSPLPLSSLYVF